MTSAMPQPPLDTRPVAAAAGTALAYTPEETARIIGGNCKASWLRTKARKGEIPFLWVGKYSFTDAHIAEIIRFCERPARAKQAAATPPPAKPAPAKRAPAPASALPLPPTGVVQLRARPPRRRGAA